MLSPQHLPRLPLGTARALLSPQHLVPPAVWCSLLNTSCHRPCGALTCGSYVLSPLTKCNDRSYYESTRAAAARMGSYLQGRCVSYEERCRLIVRRTSANRTGVPVCDGYLKAGPNTSASSACRREYEAGARWAQQLRKKCGKPSSSAVGWSMSNLNVTDELNAIGDEAIAPTRFTVDEYVRHAMSHRFCLLSHGDDPAIKKVAEAIAIAGAGGCLPLIVHPGPHAVYLPYASEVNFCKVGFIVQSNSWAMDIRRVLKLLERVTPEEAEKRHRTARSLRHAFVQREDASFTEPAAAHFLIAAMCARAKRLRDANISQCTSLRGPAALPIGVQGSQAARPKPHSFNAQGRSPKFCLP